MASLIISNAFRSFLRNQIIEPPKWWFHTIEEVANAPLNYPIYVPSNSITYFSMKEQAKYSPSFRKLLDRIKLIPTNQVFSYEIEMLFYKGKCASFTRSEPHKNHKIMAPDEIVIDEIRYDHMLDVRLIRKDFEFADQIMKL